MSTFARDFRRMMYKNYVLCGLSAIVVAVLFSCSGKNKPVTDVDDLYRQDSIESASDTLNLVPEDDGLSKSVDELFDDFFIAFVTNQKFQMQRIKFPLQCNDADVASAIKREDWETHNKFTAYDIFSVIYEDEEDILIKNDTSVRQVAIEWIDLQTDSAEIYTFKKADGEWYLRTLNKTSVEDMTNGDFLEFFSHFSNDSIFQAQSIDNPLRIITSDDIEGEGDTAVLEVNANEWNDIKNDYPLPTREIVNIDYGQPSGSLRYKQVLMQNMNNSMFIKLRFHKYSTEWKLIEIEE